MKTVAYQNNTKQTQYIGGKSVQPDETREVDARFVSSPSMLNRELLILFINFTDAPRYFGATVVQAGETMRLPLIHFENPNRLDAGNIQDVIFIELLNCKMDDIKLYLSSLEDGELARLTELEEQSKKRKSFVALIKDELAIRVEKFTFIPETYKEDIAELSDEDLALETLKASSDSQKLAMVENELMKRKKRQASQEG